MAKVFVEDETLTLIADSIREKNGTENTYKPGEMPAAIAAIETGGVSENSFSFDGLAMAQISGSTSGAYSSVNLKNYVSSIDQVKFAIWQGGKTSTTTSYCSLMIYIPQLFGDVLMKTAYTGTEYLGYIVGDKIRVAGRSSHSLPTRYILIVDGTSLKVASEDTPDQPLSNFLSKYGTFTFWYEEAAES